MKPLDEPLETFRLLLKEARLRLERPVEIILIGGAAALLSGAVSRVTEDIDILASGNSIEVLRKRKNLESGLVIMHTPSDAFFPPSAMFLDNVILQDLTLLALSVRAAQLRAVV